jgi:uncharacterized UPF0160 family protein
MNKQITIATHNGALHADDCVGVAVLMHLHPQAGLVRTRNPDEVAAADFAVDVGGIWDPASGRFDHHQKGFAGKRDNGTVYASAGLVWNEHGRAFIRALRPTLSAELVDKVFDSIDREFMEHVDRADTGAAQGAPDYFGISALLASFNVTREEEVKWGEGYEDSATRQKVLANVRLDQFREAMVFVQRLLYRLVAQAADQHLGAAQVRSAQVVENGKVLVLEQSGLIWEPVVIREMPDVMFVIYPDSTDQQYQVRTVPVELGSFKARKDLPAPWAGLRDADLSAVIGIPDAVFCHNGRFIGGAVSKESALTMAKLALAA